MPYKKNIKKLNFIKNLDNETICQILEDGKIIYANIRLKGKEWKKMLLNENMSDFKKEFK